MKRIMSHPANLTFFPVGPSPRYAGPQTGWGWGKGLLARQDTQGSTTGARNTFVATRSRNSSKSMVVLLAIASAAVLQCYRQQAPAGRRT